MPTYSVRAPDGRTYRIHGPAGATEAQVQAEVLRQNPNAGRPAKKETSFLQGVAEGALPAANNALRLMGKANPLLSLLDAATGATTRVADHFERGTKAAVDRSPYRGSTAGRVVGTMIGAAPTMGLPGGPLLQGAAAGALSSEDRSARGLAKNAAIGAAGGVVGDRLMRGAAAVVSPRVAPVIQRLQARNIPLTPGQIMGARGGVLGRAVRGAENKLTSVPGVGDAIMNAQQRGVTAFNRAAFNEALDPIAARVPQIAEEGIEQSRNAVRNAYSGALDDVRIAPDQAFADELANAAQRGLTPGNFADDFGRIMQDEVRPSIANETGEITGQGIQDSLRILNGYARRYGKLATEGAQGIPMPTARPVAGAFDDLSTSLESLINRQAPEVMPAYGAANQAYRNVGVLRDAVNAAKVGGAGEFTPAQLSQSARANAKKFGGTHGTTDQPFFDLTRDAQDVLPSTIPNSGTTDRGLLGLLLGGVGGWPAAAASGVGSIPYSQAGARAGEWLLTGRQGPIAQRLAEALRRAAPAAGIGGATGIPLLLGP